MPNTNGTFDRNALAEWYAQKHYRIDPGVVDIHHLPANAPPHEIRLLEVNRMIPEASDGPLEPIDFGVDIGSAEGHTLVVLDVTPSQFEAIRHGRLALPAGWTLDGSRTLPPPVTAP